MKTKKTGTDRKKDSEKKKSWLFVWFVRSVMKEDDTFVDCPHDGSCFGGESLVDFFFIFILLVSSLLCGRRGVRLYRRKGIPVLEVQGNILGDVYDRLGMWCAANFFYNGEYKYDLEAAVISSKVKVRPYHNQFINLLSKVLPPPPPLARACFVLLCGVKMSHSLEEKARGNGPWVLSSFFFFLSFF